MTCWHLCSMKKIDAAYSLFVDGFSQKDIADILDVAEKTVTGWKKNEKWEEKRAEKNRMRDTASDNIMKLINHQLKVLNRITKLYEDEIEGTDDIGSLNKALIQNGQIDALYKMFAAVKGKERSWEDYVKVVKELITAIAAKDIELAKKLTEPAHDFLNDKRASIS